MSEKFYDYSIYSYGQNKPISNIDIGGKFVFKDATHYPQLAKLIQSISTVLENTNVLSNLSKLSGMDPCVIRQQFQDNIGPQIVIDDLQRILDNPKVGQTLNDGTIVLDNAMVKHLENALKDGNYEEYDEYLVYITVTILHEYNHSGDIQIYGKRFADLGQPDENCLGYQFEQETFGRKMPDPSNVRKYRQERSNYIQRNSSQKNKEFWNKVQSLEGGTFHIVNGQLVQE